jgi:hypothetical protein
MQVVTKRALVATAALAAAGLFGSLPYQGPQAMRGAPTVHRDVALVDADSTLLTDEGTLDSAVYSDLSGAETGLYNAVDTAYGGGTTGATDADLLLGAGSAPDYFDNLFDGAYNYDGSALLLDTWALEDEVNQALGISATTSEDSILANITDNPVLLSGTDTLPTAGASGFDADLTTLASDDYSTASTDFTNYLDGLSTSLTTLGSTETTTGLTAVLTDLGSVSGDFTNISGDLSTVLGDLGSLF